MFGAQIFDTDVFSRDCDVMGQVGKQQEMEEAGQNPQMLAQHGILLDTDVHQDPSSQSSERRRFLLFVLLMR